MLSFSRFGFFELTVSRSGWAEVRIEVTSVDGDVCKVLQLGRYRNLYRYVSSLVDDHVEVEVFTLLAIAVLCGLPLLVHFLTGHHLPLPYATVIALTLIYFSLPFALELIEKERKRSFRDAISMSVIGEGIVYTRGGKHLFLHINNDDWLVLLPNLGDGISFKKTFLLLPSARVVITDDKCIVVNEEKVRELMRKVEKFEQTLKMMYFVLR